MPQTEIKNSETALLELQGVSAGYRNPLVSDVNLILRKGVHYVLRGPNGSGKTTLLRTILGLQPVLSGRILYYNRRAGYVPQIRESLRFFPVTIQGGLEADFLEWKYFLIPSHRSYREQRIREAMEITGLEKKKKLLLRECSGGELQRFLIARAILKKPDFLVMDEPFSSVDSGGRTEITEILNRYMESEKPAVLYTTHEADSLLTGKETRLVISDGRLLI